MMRVSAHGRAFIKHEEGLVLRVYLDKYNNPTCGTGHLCRPPTAFGPVGTPISQALADQLLAQDLATVEGAIAARITVPVTQNQIDALASWLFNVGAGFADPSKHDLPRLLDAGDYAGAAEAFGEYDVANGHHDAILHARRLREAALFRTPDGTTLPVYGQLSGPIVSKLQLQHALNCAGASPSLAEDGAFGSRTLAAVVAFQRAHGLTPDGVPGPATLAALAA